MPVPTRQRRPLYLSVDPRSHPAILPSRSFPRRALRSRLLLRLTSRRSGSQMKTHLQQRCPWIITSIALNHHPARLAAANPASLAEAATPARAASPAATAATATAASLASLAAVALARVASPVVPAAANLASPAAHIPLTLAMMATSITTAAMEVDMEATPAQAQAHQASQARAVDQEAASQARAATQEAASPARAATDPQAAASTMDMEATAAARAPRLASRARGGEELRRMLRTSAPTCVLPTTDRNRSHGYPYKMLTQDDMLRVCALLSTIWNR
mmetsp:Transcript_1401/g.3549  ORF Transcript_1401/g.3549 Transcript_1401/m.3549 type:complete len:277 (+) Transcript_1401:184-1014(+)